MTDLVAVTIGETIGRHRPGQTTGRQLRCQPRRVVARRQHQNRAVLLGRSRLAIPRSDRGRHEIAHGDDHVIGNPLANAGGDVEHVLITEGFGSPDKVFELLQQKPVHRVEPQATVITGGLDLAQLVLVVDDDIAGFLDSEAESQLGGPYTRPRPAFPAGRADAGRSRSYVACAQS